MDYWKMVRYVRSPYGLDGPPGPPARAVHLSGDDLAADFEALAHDDPDMTICLHGISDAVVATLSAGRAHPDSTQRFEELAQVAVSRFDRNGAGDALERWLRLVAQNAPHLIARDPGGGTIRNAAHASALAVRRLRDSVVRLRNRENPDAVPTGPTPERDDSALVIRDAQGREVAAGQIADGLAELNARLAARPAAGRPGATPIPDPVKNAALAELVELTPEHLSNAMRDALRAAGRAARKGRAGHDREWTHADLKKAAPCATGKLGEFLRNDPRFAPVCKPGSNRDRR